MADGGRLERRSGDEGEQARHVRQHLRRCLEGRVDLAAERGQLEREPSGPRVLPRERLVREEAIAALGRHATGRRVWMREQPPPLELRELVSHGRRRDGQDRGLDEVLRPHRLPRRDVLLHDAREDVALPRGELDVIPGHLQGF